MAIKETYRPARDFRQNFTIWRLFHFLESVNFTLTKKPWLSHTRPSLLLKSSKYQMQGFLVNLRQEMDLYLLVMAVHCVVPPGLGGDTELVGDGVAHHDGHGHRHQVQRHPLTLTWLCSLSPLFHFSTLFHFHCQSPSWIMNMVWLQSAAYWSW